MRLVNNVPEVVLSMTISDCAMLSMAAHALVDIRASAVVRVRGRTDSVIGGPMRDTAWTSYKKAIGFEIHVQEILEGKVGKEIE